MLLLKTSSTRFQRNNFTSSKTSGRRLGESWRHLGRYSRCLGRRKIVMLETSWHVLKKSSRDVWKICWGHVFKTSTRDVLKTCWGHVFKTSWRHYGDKQNIYWGFLYLKNISQIYIWQFYVFQDVLKTSWRYLARHLEYVFKAYSRHLGRRKIFTLETSSRSLEDMTWRHDLKTSWRHVLKTLWRQTKYLLEISVSRKSKFVPNKSVFHKSMSDNSKENLNCIN